MADTMLFELYYLFIYYSIQLNLLREIIKKKIKNRINQSQGKMKKRKRFCENQLEAMMVLAWPRLH